jgi:hypothetical protein
MRRAVENFESNATTKLKILKTSTAIILVFLLVAISLFIYPARFHLKNKFLAPPLGSYSCRIHDKSGKKLAEGRFSIQHFEGTGIAGNWQFTPMEGVKRDGVEWRYTDERLRSFIGQITKDEFEINMNPHVDDSNDYLRGKLVGTEIRGNFLFCGFTGCTTNGSFEAIRE